MRRQAVSNVAFYVVTVVLILIIVLCVGGTARSESRDEAQRVENRVQEQLTDVRQYLKNNGYTNSGVTLTYVTDADGDPEYTFTIHHKRINDMSEEEREAFSAELMQACNASGSYSISYEYLLTDF